MCGERQLNCVLFFPTQFRKIKIPIGLVSVVIRRKSQFVKPRIRESTFSPIVFRQWLSLLHNLQHQSTENTHYEICNFRSFKFGVPNFTFTKWIGNQTCFSLIVLIPNQYIFCVK